MQAPTIYRIGNATVVRVQERLITFQPRALLPDWPPAADGANADEALTVSVHTWLVRTPFHTVLVDTGIGNGKSRSSPLFDHLDTPYLANLASFGVTPEAVTHVLLTHVHTDHVGWNTRLADGRWVPTFPAARYIFPRAGHEYFASPQGPARANYDMYADSVAPIIEAGQADMVGPEGGPVLDGFVYHPTPGHSVDHMSIAFGAQDERALFAGDVMHHPIQVDRPRLNSIFCADRDQARVSRQWALAYASEQRALYLSSHFPESGAGTITRTGERFDWRFA